ncbi:unnamed protein product [Rangifer tarandus platyrhynchus]|uniref:Uncharacterized protein n=1 Tax=Rangifer tarandus platyrhynchus TaxID=3082113 RepID=A0AC59Z5M9_RANTA
METPGLCCVRTACLNVWGFKLPSLSLSHSLTPSLPSLYPPALLSVLLSLFCYFFFSFLWWSLLSVMCRMIFFFFDPLLHPAIPMSKQFGINYISLPPSEL